MSNVDGDILRRAVAKVAAAALLGRYFAKDGTRNEAFMALAGTLARAGWPEEEIVHFNFAIYKILWDRAANLSACKSEVRPTYEKVARGENVYGIPKLKVLVNPQAVDKALAWLDIKSTQSVPQSQFRVTDDGVFRITRTEEGEEKRFRISARVDVIARTSNGDGSNCGRLLRWVDVDGRVHQWAMPLEMFAQSTLRRFTQQKKYAAAEGESAIWIRVAERAEWKQLLDVQKDYTTAEAVRVRKVNYTVFNICHNQFRLIVEINYQNGLLWVKSLLTHAEYTKATWKTILEKEQEQREALQRKLRRSK